MVYWHMAFLYGIFVSFSPGLTRFKINEIGWMVFFAMRKTMLLKMRRFLLAGLTVQLRFWYMTYKQHGTFTQPMEIRQIQTKN